MFFCIHPTQSQSPHSQYSVFLWFYDPEPQNGALSFELVEFMCLVFTRMPAEWSQAIRVFVDTLFLSMWHLLTTDVVWTLYLLACQLSDHRRFGSLLIHYSYRCDIFWPLMWYEPCIYSHASWVITGDSGLCWYIIHIDVTSSDHWCGMNLVFTRMPGESDHRRLGSLLIHYSYRCDIFWPLMWYEPCIYSHASWVITGDWGLCWYIILIDVTSSDHWCGINLVFTRMPGESDHRRLGSLLIHYSYRCDIFWPLMWYEPCIYSHARWEWSQAIGVFVDTLFLSMWHLLTTDVVWTLYLLACQVRVITGDWGLCWYIILINMTSSDHWNGMNLVFTRMPGESDHRWFGFLLLHYSCWCDIFWPLTWYTPCIYSCAKWEWSQVIWVFVVTLFLFMWHLLTTDKVLFRSFQFIPSSKKNVSISSDNFGIIYINYVHCTNHTKTAYSVASMSGKEVSIKIATIPIICKNTMARQLTLWHQWLAKRFR